MNSMNGVTPSATVELGFFLATNLGISNEMGSLLIQCGQVKVYQKGEEIIHPGIDHADSVCVYIPLFPTKSYTVSYNKGGNNHTENRTGIRVLGVAAIHSRGQVCNRRGKVVAAEDLEVLVVNIVSLMQRCGGNLPEELVTLAQQENGRIVREGLSRT